MELLHKQYACLMPWSGSGKCKTQEGAGPGVIVGDGAEVVARIRVEVGMGTEDTDDAADETEPGAGPSRFEM